MNEVKVPWILDNKGLQGCCLDFLFVCFENLWENEYPYILKKFKLFKWNKREYI